MTSESASADAVASFPERIFAVASPLSLGGRSMLTSATDVSAQSVVEFTSSSHILQQSVALLSAEGFDILHVSPLMINIAGSRELYERAFNTTLSTTRQETRKEANRCSGSTQIHSKDDRSGHISIEGTRFAGVLEGIAIEVPRYLMLPQEGLPLVAARSIHPGDISLALNAERAHRMGYTGRHSRIAVVDSGFSQHAYFIDRGYNITSVLLGPGAAGSNTDEIGHGTSMIANVLAVAPDAHILPIKIAHDGRATLVNSLGAFNAAMDQDPNIISCSWGSNREQEPLLAADHALAAAISYATALGKVVVCAAGNGHSCYPAAHPEVLSVGGAQLTPEGKWSASANTSRFISKIFPDRQVPDVCGVIGNTPQSDVINASMEPGDSAEEKCEDKDTAFSNPNDAVDISWTVNCGSSVAAAQLAGATAIIQQSHPGLDPPDVREVIKHSARDLIQDRENVRSEQSIDGGVDIPTGHGVVDITAAVLLAAVWEIEPAADTQPVSNVTAQSQSIGPIYQESRQMFPFRPIQPLQPFQPTIPRIPFGPAQPFQPAIPRIPFGPAQPFQPAIPRVPFGPAQPFLPIVPRLPFTPTQPLRPIVPRLPFTPTQPIRPIVPRLPFLPTQPLRPIIPRLPFVPAQPLRPIVPRLPFVPTLPLRPIIPRLPFVPTLPLRPIIPRLPFVPTLPLRPIVPRLPFTPLQPLRPTAPLRPVGPLRPLQPAIPIRPLVPLRPLVPRVPFLPSAPFGPGPLTGSLGQAEWDQQAQWEAQQQADWEQHSQWEEQQHQANWEQQAQEDEQQQLNWDQQAQWEAQQQAQWEAQQQANWDQQAQSEAQQQADWDQQAQSEAQQQADWEQQANWDQQAQWEAQQQADWDQQTQSEAQQQADWDQQAQWEAQQQADWDQQAQWEAQQQADWEQQAQWEAQQQSDWEQQAQWDLQQQRAEWKRFQQEGSMFQPPYEGDS